MFINPNFSNRPAASGFTLIELLVSTAIGAIAMAFIMSVTFYTGRSIASLTDSVHLSNDSRAVIDRMSQKIREAEEVTAYATNSITVDVGGGSNLTYSFLENERMLIEIENNATNVLLDNCTSLQLDRKS